MKNTLYPLLLLMLLFAFRAEAQNPAYDSLLAIQYGADELGMKSYILVILVTGDSVITDAGRRKEMFEGHFANINRLSDEGKLVVAGPFGKNNISYRGLFILNTTSETEADQWMQGDPTITGGIFKTLMVPWYGSAALPAHIEIHKKISKKSI